ncbi:hypothetical protein QVD17_20741 [Tagetes erecta]|uniref:Transmembrane protein n=1 Tax=Tagetes erecta TaxID=13708 RepID=A0AAD8NYD6_TARER|nr:hypothetical protein QVD17_20741 [Tagetes erecta]
MCCGDCNCRPIGFLLGLPFALVSFLLSIVGVFVWTVGLLLTCICPCCLCVTVIVAFALKLIKAPFHVMRWFTSKIPC